MMSRARDEIGLVVIISLTIMQCSLLEASLILPNGSEEEYHIVEGSKDKEEAICTRNNA